MAKFRVYRFTIDIKWFIIRLKSISKMKNFIFKLNLKYPFGTAAVGTIIVFLEFLKMSQCLEICELTRERERALRKLSFRMVF